MPNTQIRIHEEDFGVEYYNALVLSNSKSLLRVNYYEYGYFKSFGPVDQLLDNSKGKEKEIIQLMLDTSYPLSRLAAAHSSSTQVMAVALVFLDAGYPWGKYRKGYYEDWFWLRQCHYLVRNNTSRFNNEIIHFTNKYVNMLCSKMGRKVVYAKRRPMFRPNYSATKQETSIPSKSGQSTYPHAIVPDTEEGGDDSTSLTGRLSDKDTENRGKVRPIFSIEATPKEVGARVRAARNAKGWSQRELADAMGHKSVRGVQNLENAYQNPSLEVIRAAMEALEINTL